MHLLCHCHSPVWSAWVGVILSAWCLRIQLGKVFHSVLRSFPLLPVHLPYASSNPRICLIHPCLRDTAFEVIEPSFYFLVKFLLGFLYPSGVPSCLRFLLSPFGTFLSSSDVLLHILCTLVLFVWYVLVHMTIKWSLRTVYRVCTIES